MSKPTHLLPQKIALRQFCFFCCQKNIGPTGRDKKNIEIIFKMAGKKRKFN